MDKRNATRRERCVEFLRMLSMSASWLPYTQDKETAYLHKSERSFAFW